jgi:formylglycine-generating enzyme required for sulfatase activity
VAPGHVSAPHLSPPDNSQHTVKIGAASSSQEPAKEYVEVRNHVENAFRDCEDIACPWMVTVPSGHFMMGSPDGEKSRNADESPMHEVQINYALSVSKYLITRGEWRKYVSVTGRSVGGDCYGFEKSSKYTWQNPGFPQEDSHPVVCVTWNEAVGYAAWLSKKTRHKYRLLTEAEYEYVARANTEGAYWWGTTDDNQCNVTNGADAALRTGNGPSSWSYALCRDGFAFTSPVDHFTANAFGVHDATGNVSSWTQDCYRDTYGGAPTDGSAWETDACDARVIRGGSWADPPSRLRVADRYRANSSWATTSVGFRLARTN